MGKDQPDFDPQVGVVLRMGMKRYDCMHVGKTYPVLQADKLWLRTPPSPVPAGRVKLICPSIRVIFSEGEFNPEGNRRHAGI